MKIVGIKYPDNSGVNNVICIIPTYIYKYLRQKTSHNALLCRVVRIHYVSTSTYVKRQVIMHYYAV